MTRACLLISVIMSALLAGCVQSLHPYYTEAQLTYDPVLVGTWGGQDEKGKVVITGDAENKVYQAVYTDEDNKPGKFELHLAKAGEQLLVDIAPHDPKRENESEMYTAHLLPMHSFMLLEVKDKDTLAVRQMDYDWLKKHLEKNPNAVAHEIVDGDRIVLTAPSEKVQAFVLEQVKTAEAYGEPTLMKRVPDGK